MSERSGDAPPEADGCGEGLDDYYWHMAEAAERRKQAIDDEDEESFPASDPPSHNISDGPRIGG
jgi:hypothetical protein